MNTLERIVDIAASYRRKTLSPVEVVETHLERIERLNPTLNAFVTVTADSALEEARRAEAELFKGRDRGLMHGIPIALKDLVDTEGVRTTCGSRLRAAHIPAADAKIVRRLKDAGAISLGKTNMLEFAYGVVHPDFGPTLNPWNVGRTAGGSSGGSAAAVAAGLCCAAVGTDTGGSIRIPASYCGVAGFKPSYGLVDLDGVFPLSWSLDHVGPIARSSRDAAAFLEALTGHAFGASDGLSGLRCGTDPAYLERTQVQPAVLEAFRLACDVFRSAGATIVEVRLADLERANDALLDLLLPEASMIHEDAFTNNEEGYAPGTREQLKQGFTVSATAYLRAQQFQKTLQSRFAEQFLSLESILMPTAPWVAPAEDPSVTGDEGDAEMHFTGPFNLLGLPALSVSCGVNDGLPIGLQIVTGYQKDTQALSIGAAFEVLCPVPIPDPSKFNS
jgi:aspartyl-tRNA(Asn)/glutamyl-tRNA(Gln) amidotransferase subunit A